MRCGPRTEPRMAPIVTNEGGGGDASRRAMNRNVTTLWPFVPKGPTARNHTDLNVTTPWPMVPLRATAPPSHQPERDNRPARTPQGPTARNHTSLGQRPRYPHSIISEGLKARPIPHDVAKLLRIDRTFRHHPAAAGPRPSQRCHLLTPLPSQLRRG